MTRRLLAGLVAVVVLLLAVPTGASALDLFGDCKGDPPLPSDPMSGLGFSMKPTITHQDPQAPFQANSAVSLESVYGTSYRWWNYDNGCAPGADIMPSTGASLGSMGLEFAGLLPSWAHSMLDAVVSPGWLAPLDQPIAAASDALFTGVWQPWAALGLTLAALLVLLRARSGLLAGSVTAALWALVVLVAVTWTIKYPTESVRTMDDGVRGAVINIANGFSGTEAGGGSSEDQALRAVDRQMDDLVRSTAYDTWLKGALGSADSATARTYGPRLFEATHLTWAEAEDVRKAPSGEGKKLIEAKQQKFEDVAAKVQDADPAAYDALTGNNWGQRIGLALVDVMVSLVVFLFLFLACVGVLMAFAVARILVPLAPAAGVIFLVESTRDVALGALRKVAGPLLMGPVFFAAALVLLRIESAVLTSSIPWVLQVVWVLVFSVAAWKLLRPASHLRLRVPGMRVLTAYLAGRAGGREGARDGVEDAATEGSAEGTAPAATRPVGRLPGSSSRPIYTALPAPSTASTIRVASERVAVPDEGHSMGDQTPLAAIGRHHDQSARLPAPVLLAPVPADRSVPHGTGPRPESQRPVGERSSAAGVHEAQPSHEPSAAVNGHTSVLMDARPGDPTEAGSTSRPPAEPIPPGRSTLSGDPEARDVHEANLVRDENGDQVFVIYHPDLSRRSGTRV